MEFNKEETIQKGVELKKRIARLKAEAESEKKKTQTWNRVGNQHQQQTPDKQDREKERHLQKKINELTSQVTRLEKRVALLKQENLTLKKKAEEQKPTEEKIKKLKKRNAELAAIARRLEEKAKQLQHEQIKHQHSASSTSSQDVEQIKRAFAKQRAKDLAEFAKNTMAKDRDIEELRKKCQQLTDKLASVQAGHNVENPDLYGSTEELESLIKQAARDRLRLEKEINRLKLEQNNVILEQEQLQQLQAENEALRADVAQLQESLMNTQHLQKELEEKITECAALYRQIEDTKQRQMDLERELNEVIEKNTHLTQQNRGLHEQLQQVGKLVEECERLTVCLSAAEEKCQQAENDKMDLQQKVGTLQEQTKAMKNLEEQKKRLEQEQKTTLEMLKEKQAEIEQLLMSKEDEKKQNLAKIADLETKLRELERKYELQLIQQEELAVEMEELRKEAEIAKFRPEMHTIDVQTDKTKGVSPSPLNTSTNLNESLSQATSDKAAVPDLNISAKVNERVNKITNDFTQGLRNKKIPFQVYVAKYNYDPEQCSPNENPDAELSLAVGDYIFIYGDVDEDGFYEGELMDGRRGLVPSNFVEKVPDEDLEDFHATIGLAGHNQSQMLNNASFQQDLNFDSSEGSEQAASLPDDNRVGVRHSLDYSHTEYNIDTNDIQMPYSASAITIGELDGSNQAVPSPTDLRLVRELHDSVLISWTPPRNTSVQAYHIYVDGQFNMAVKATDRAKALIEDISSDKVHRISVCTVTPEGQSDEEQCTILFGKGAPARPSNLKVSNITDSSAVVSWLPSNSNIEHRITVNNQSSFMLRPGVYRCLLSGLVAGCSYQVTVTEGAQQSDNSRLAVASFCTLEKAVGVPDVPVDVQVEIGPKQGSLLVTWLPVTITSTGMSNGVFVTGYNIYIDGHRVKSVESPTGDHVILEASDIYSVATEPHTLTVRTQAVDLESNDSQPVTLTADLLKEVLSSNKPKMKLLAKVQEQDSGTDLSDIAEVEEEDDKGTPKTVQKLRHDGIPPGSSPRTIGAKQKHAQHMSPASSPPRAIYGNRNNSHTGAVDNQQNRLATNLDHNKRSRAKSPEIIVPQIEITKSSSFSGPENLSDEDMGGQDNYADDYRYVDQRNRNRLDNYDSQVDRMDTDVHLYSHGANRDLQDYYEEPVPMETIRQKEKEYNDRNVAKTKQISREQDNKRVDNKHGIEGKYHRQAGGRQERSPSNLKRDSRTPTDVSSRQDKRRHSKGTKTPQYDDESSYSQLEDNNILTSKGIRNDIPLSDLIDYEDDGGESLLESVDMEYDESRVRIFIALFDYDPAVMSPNPDAVEEELAFKEGQLIKVYGEKDADGFFIGESQGRRGYVPCNMVSEVEVDDPEIAEQLLKETCRAGSRPVMSGSRGSTPGTHRSRPTSQTVTTPRSQYDNMMVKDSSLNDILPPTPPDGPIKQMVALYSYDPHSLSPNVDSELELAFRAGDRITVYGDMDEDGFYYGELNGQRGLVPSNFLEEVAPEYAQPEPGHRPEANANHQARHSDSHSRPAKTMVTDHNAGKPSKETHTAEHSPSKQNHVDNKMVTFVPTKPQRPSQPARQTNAIQQGGFGTDSTARHEGDSPKQTKKQPEAESPPPSPHNILNLDIENVKEKKKKFFSRGIFKKIGK